MKTLITISRTTGQKCYYDGHGFSLVPDHARPMSEERALVLASLLSVEYMQPVCMVDVADKVTVV